MEQINRSYLPLLLLAAPVAMALIALAARRRREVPIRQVMKVARFAAPLALLTSLLAPILLVFSAPATSPLLGLGGIGLSFRLDALSAILAPLVAFIAVVVLRFSRRYLAGDPRQGVFLGDLGLVAASTLLLVSAGNVVQLAAAWLLGGLALRRLLVFRGERPGARSAARRKYVIATAGDLALVGAVLLIVRQFGSTDIAFILAEAGKLAPLSLLPLDIVIAAGLLAFAAMMKSVQFPAHLWLPAAMEAPTPVSALLHAGVVNAGGFLVVRFADLMLLVPGAMLAILVVGGFTAVFGSLVMTLQTSVKARLAWSTIAQMGLMMFQCGLGAFGFAVLHIVAHSLYKAEAFLGSGRVVEENYRTLQSGSAGAELRLPAWAIVTAIPALALVLWTLDRLLGADFTLKPGAFFLGAAFVLALAPMLGRALATRRIGTVLRSAAVTTALLALYLTLSVAVGRAFAGSLPEVAQPQGAAFVLALGVISGLLALTFLPSLRRSESWAGWNVHLRHGLYLPLLFDRLLGRLFSRSTSSPLRGLPR